MNTYPFTFGMKTLRAPYDDISGEILKEVGAATKSILVMIYGYHWPDLTTLLIQKHQAGILVQMVMDLSQSKGVAEREEVQTLKDAGIDIVVGTAPSGNIMHEKALIIDGYRTITGSFNFSLNAPKQVNHTDFVKSQDRAFMFTQFFSEIRAEMLAKETK